MIHKLDDRVRERVAASLCRELHRGRATHEHADHGLLRLEAMVGRERAVARDDGTKDLVNVGSTERVLEHRRRLVSGRLRVGGIGLEHQAVVILVGSVG